MSARILVIYLLLSVQAMAQGFAGLGTTSEGFAQPKRGTELQFPGDHGAHPDFRVEWWYLTANLKGPEGEDLGIQWTLFRSALKPAFREGWGSNQVWMGHAAVTTASQHLFVERLGRGGIGQAGVTSAPFAAWIDNWEMKSVNSSDINLSKLAIRAAGSEFSYDLSLTASSPLVLHGDHGYSVKSLRGQASYYYSQPSFQVEGVVRLPSGDLRVTGQAWLDHEWSSQPLDADQSGWDWFSLHFDSGEKLMAFRLRDGGAGFSSATWIDADGNAQPLASQQISLTPLESESVGGLELPVRWRIEIPSKQLDVVTTALNAQSWMGTQISYWEGPVRVEGSTAGRGYLEMTGYR
jgi:predicted secreted hydrolase